MAFGSRAYKKFRNFFNEYFAEDNAETDTEKNLLVNECMDDEEEEEEEEDDDEEENAPCTGLIQIDGDIDLHLFRDFKERFIELSFSEEIDKIEIHITSTGGQAEIGNAIYHLISKCSKPTTTIAFEASSIAGIILQAGKIRKITKTGIIVLHRPKMQLDGLFGIEGLESRVKVLKKRWKINLNIISKKTGKSIKEINDAIGYDQISFNAKEALQFGLVDEII